MKNLLIILLLLPFGLFAQFDGLDTLHVKNIKFTLDGSTQSGSSSSLYTTNDTLTGARTVYMNSNTLNFTGSDFGINGSPTKQLTLFSNSTGTNGSDGFQYSNATETIGYRMQTDGSVGFSNQVRHTTYGLNSQGFLHYAGGSDLAPTNSYGGCFSFRAVEMDSLNDASFARVDANRLVTFTSNITDRFQIMGLGYARLNVGSSASSYADYGNPTDLFEILGSSTLSLNLMPFVATSGAGNKKDSPPIEFTGRYFTEATGLSNTISSKIFLDVPDTTGTYNLDFDGGAMILDNNGDVSIGTSATTARFTVRGSDNVGTTEALLVENLAGTDAFRVMNDGTTTFGTAVAEQGITNTNLIASSPFNVGNYVLMATSATNPIGIKVSYSSGIGGTGGSPIGIEAIQGGQDAHNTAGRFLSYDYSTGGTARTQTGVKGQALLNTNVRGTNTLVGGHFQAGGQATSGSALASTAVKAETYLNGNINITTAIGVDVTSYGLSAADTIGTWTGVKVDMGSTGVVTNRYAATFDNGNVGIGTVSPSFLLEVDGQTKTDSLSLQSGSTIKEFSTDGTLADSSDSAVPTEQAIKAYIDAATSFDYGTQGFADSSITIAMTQNQYHQVTNATNSLYADGVLNGITTSGDSLQVNKTCDYEIMWDLSYKGANTDEYHISIFVNNVEQNGKGETIRDMTGTSIGVAASSTILNLSDNDWVKLMIKNVNNNNDATVVAGNITLIELK